MKAYYIDLIRGIMLVEMVGSTTVSVKFRRKKANVGLLIFSILSQFVVSGAKRRLKNTRGLASLLLMINEITSGSIETARKLVSHQPVR